MNQPIASRGLIRVFYPVKLMVDAAQMNRLPKFAISPQASKWFFASKQVLQ